jgi:hypothetical protein
MKLQSNNAGDIIAELIIERQIQKLTREQFTSGDPGRIDEK